MDDFSSIAYCGIEMSIAPELDLLHGVFAFLDASLPDSIREAAIEKDFGIGRLAPMPEKARAWRSTMEWKLRMPSDQFIMGYVAEGYEREIIAKVINATFRLQWKGCPLRPFLASYRLYHRDDMADALAAAYGQYKRAGDLEAALHADYSVEFDGILTQMDLDKIRNDKNDYFWSRFQGVYEDGDRIVNQDAGPYEYYLLVRGDRLVWKVESLHKQLLGPSLKREAEEAHFVALGGCKAFLNGAFTWPPLGWVNPVSDEEETASLKKGYKKISEFIAEG